MVAKPDLAGENPGTGFWTEVGGQHVLGDPFLDGDLIGDRQAPLYSKQGPDVAIAEAARPVRGPRTDDAVATSGFEGYDVGEIVGAAGVLQIGQDVEIEQRLVARQAPPKQGDPALEHVVVRAAGEETRVHVVAKARGLDAAAPMPGKPPRLQHRMQGPKGDVGADQRYAGAMEPLAAAGDQRLHLGAVEGPVHQPVGDLVDQDRTPRLAGTARGGRVHAVGLLAHRIISRGFRRDSRGASSRRRRSRAQPAVFRPFRNGLVRRWHATYTLLL